MKQHRDARTVSADGVCPSSATIRRVAHGTFKRALSGEGAGLRWEGDWQKQDDKVLCKRCEEIGRVHV